MKKIYLLIGAFTSQLGCQNIDMNKYTLETTTAGGKNAVLMGDRAGNPSIERGKGIGLACFFGIVDGANIELLNRYFFNSVNNVQISTSYQTPLGGTDVTYYNSEKIENIIDVSNFLSIFYAFSKLYSKK